MLAAGCAGGGSERAGPKPRLILGESVELPSARDPLKLTFPTPWSVGDVTAAVRRMRRAPSPTGRVVTADNYHVIFDGPGGEDCRGRLHFALGYAADRRRAARRRVTIPPHREARFPLRERPWCPGTYRGHVEFRQPDRSPAIPFVPLGRFRFRVPGGR